MPCIGKQACVSSRQTLGDLVTHKKQFKMQALFACAVSLPVIVTIHAQERTKIKKEGSFECAVS